MVEFRAFPILAISEIQWCRVSEWDGPVVGGKRMVLIAWETRKQE